MRSAFLILSFVTCAVLSASSQTLSQKIEKAYSLFERDPQMQYGMSSLSVLNAQTGEIIFSKNPMGLAPASTLKTVTSATAYYVLGTDFKYETTLGYSGAVDNAGTLNGDIIVSGTGDPTLGSSRYDSTKEQLVLKRWTDAIRKAGIKKVNGRIIGDDRLYGTQTMPDGWIWQDMGNYFGAGASALNWRENEFGVVFNPGNRPGDLTTMVRANPEMSYLKIVNEVITGSTGSGDGVYAYSAPYSNTIYLRGSYGIDLKKEIKLSLPDPAFDAVYRLEIALKNLDIAVSGKATTANVLAANNEKLTPVSTVLTSQTSPGIHQIIYWLNQESLNLYAECLLKAIAIKQDNKAGTADGVKAVKDFWEKKAGLDKKSMAILDGSGLSPENRITTLSMARVLLAAKKEPWFTKYLESFPTNNATKMKSGSIKNVLAYAGYQTSADGVPLTFSFITNNYNGSTSAIKQKMFTALNSLK